MMDVQQTLRKLKPMIGQKADQFWLAYLAEDRIGKAEMETMLGLWANKLLGNSIDTVKTELSSPPSQTAAGDYHIGEVVYAGKTQFPFGIRENEWVQHTAIFGRSGAGKTNVVFKILDSFLNKKKPFLIFDWKRNYRDILAKTDQDINVFTVGRETVPFQFNPLIPPEGTNPHVWLKKLIEIVAKAYYVGEGVMYLFQEAINAVYDEFKVYSGSPQKYPTFSDVYKWLENNPVKGRKALWMDSAIRTIKSICFGFMGKVVNTSRQPNIGELLTKNVILELDSLTNADKTLIIESLLLWIHHYRLAQPQRETFKHAIIIEEAHHILLKQTGGRKETITETVLREIRELGEAIILIDQHPSLISIPALGNSYTTITLNLKHRSDVTAISSAMLLKDEEKEIIGRLPIGSAAVKLQGRWMEPFQVKIPLISVPKGIINDQRLKAITTGKGLAPKREEKSKEIMKIEKLPELLQKEIIFLQDIINHPFSGVVERYKRLGTSRRKGNVTKEKLLNKRIIQQVNIPTYSGKVVLIELTSQGIASLKQVGINTKNNNRWGGLEHEYWKHKIAEHYKKAGYKIKLEEPVNGFTDIIAEKNGKKTAIEIETGKSDWKKNIKKNTKKGFDKIMIFATNNEAFQTIKRSIEETPFAKTVSILPVQAILTTNSGASGKMAGSNGSEWRKRQVPENYNRSLGNS